MKKIKSTAVVFGDMHFPLHDEPAFSCALKVLEKVKPDVFINLGDFAEGEFVSHWRWSRRKRPPLEYQLPLITKEADIVNHHMDRIDKVLDKNIYLNDCLGLKIGGINGIPMENYLK
jgi:hypothetical protein